MTKIRVCIPVSTIHVYEISVDELSQDGLDTARSVGMTKHFSGVFPDAVRHVDSLEQVTVETVDGIEL